MTLLAPWALWFLPVALGVVALYFLKIRRRTQSVPSLEFWLALAGRTRVHSLLERLKRLLSMLLWLAVVACLLLAVGNPLLSLGRIRARAIAVIIDNSASMQTVEDPARGTTRLDEARAALRELTTRRPVSDQWLLIEAAREPRVRHPWTLDAKAVRAAADAVEPFAGSGDPRAAVELAAQLLAGKADPCIVFISDGGAGALRALPESSPAPLYWPVGHTADNVGIVRLSVRPHRQNANYQALVSIRNASSERVETRLTLEIEGRTHDVRLVSIDPGGTWEQTIVIESPGGGLLRASIDRPDALALDDEAYAVLEPIRPATVWLVTAPEQAFFFEQALGSMDDLVLAQESLTLTPDQYQAALASLGSPGSALRRPQLTIFNNCAPDTLPPAGKFVFVNAWPKEVAPAPKGQLDAPALALDPRPHPITQHLSLHGVRLARARQVALTSPARLLAHSPNGDPLLFLVEQPERQALCLAFDVLESDIPFRNAFPLLLRNTVSFMHTEAPAWVRPEYRIGEAVHALRPLPAGASPLSLTVVRGKTGTDAPLGTDPGKPLFTQTTRPEALRLRIGEESAAAAVNLADASETLIAPLPAGEDPARALSLSGRVLGVLPWIALATLATALVALEWLTYHFRWTE